MMTTNNGMPSAARASAVDIDRVDAFAKRLYRCARNAGGDFSDISTVVRGLHTVLKHLKVEAEDPDSLLNTDQSPVYVRQLTPIVEDCEFTLKQLDTILEKCGANFSGSDEEGRNGVIKDRNIEDREHNMIALIRTKLSNQKLNIDMFLDTVQLHNPSKSHRIVDPNNANLDSIKDKVDVIAGRIFQRKNSNSSDADDQLWQQFRDELIKDGFSGNVLRKHQDVLRAYIRQLDEQNTAGINPSVREFLEGYQLRGEPSQAMPYPVYPPSEDLSPKEIYPSIDNEKFFLSMKMERLQPDRYPPYSSSLPTQSTGLSYDRHSSEDDDYDDGVYEDGGANPSMALVISTRDLMAIDKRDADLAMSMGNMHLQPHGPNYTHTSPGTSPQAHFLPPPSNAGLLTTSSPKLPPVDQCGLSPRFVPPLPPYGSSPPPTLHSNSISAPVLSGGAPMGAPHTGAQRYARLAPDSMGRDIPLDAKWTRIRRSLVSPEVLNQAGVRYEARPEFVAILGVYTKEQIEDFARQSAEVRRRRGDQRRRQQRDEKDRYYPDKYKNWDVEAQRSNGRPRGNDNHSSSSELYDSQGSDEFDDEPPSYRPRATGSDYHPQDEKRRDSKDDKGTKAYPFIVSPPDKEKVNGTSPSATVKPKPILKNKNDDPHVRFDPEPHVLDDNSPRSVPRRSDRRDDNRDRRHRDDGNRERNRERSMPRSYDERDHRDRDHARDRDEEYRRRHRHHHSESSGGGGGGGGGGGRRDRERDEHSRRRSRRDDRDRYRDRDEERRDRSEERAARKKTRNDALRAVGIGGAAASLLSVLTEAAAGL